MLWGQWHRVRTSGQSANHQGSIYSRLQGFSSPLPHLAPVLLSFRPLHPLRLPHLQRLAVKSELFCGPCSGIILHCLPSLARRVYFLLWMRSALKNTVNGHLAEALGSVLVCEETGLSICFPSSPSFSSYTPFP